VRNAFASIELIETLLDGRHKLDALGNLVYRAVVRQVSNRLKHNLFLSHASIMKLQRGFRKEKNAQNERL
jgi:hypothetical protein